MVRFSLAAMVLVAIVLPTGLSAQWNNAHLVEEERPRFHLSPYLAVQVPYLASGTYGFRILNPAERPGGREFFFWDRETVNLASVGVGLQGNYAITPVWGVRAFVTYTPAVDAEIREEEWEVMGQGTIGEVNRYRTTGPDLLVTSIAATAELPRGEGGLQGFPVRGSVSLGPAWIRQGPRPVLGLGEGSFKPINHFGVNLGVDASLPLDFMRGLSAYAGADANLAFWNTAEMERQEQMLFQDELGFTEVIVEYDYNPGFLAGFRLGVSYGF